MLKHLWREHKESITTSGLVSTAQPNTEGSAAFFYNFKRKLMHLGVLLLSWSKKKRICFEFKVFIRSYYCPLLCEQVYQSLLMLSLLFSRYNETAALQQPPRSAAHSGDKTQGELQKQNTNLLEERTASRCL